MSKQLEHCMVCGTELNEDQSLFCSKDCYEINAVDIARTKRKMSAAPTNESGLTWKGRRTLKWLKHTCDWCGKEFTPPTTNTYCCSPQCQALWAERAAKSPKYRTKWKGHL